MRKLFFLPVLFFSFSTFAQADISAGVLVTIGGSMSLKKDIDVLASIAPAFSLATEKTSHHIMVALAQNKDFEVKVFAQTLHTYSIGNDWEVYGFFQTPLGKGNSYLSLGLEKVMTTMSQSKQLSTTKVIPFLEFGTNLKSDYFVSLGFIFNFKVLGK